MRTMSEQDGGVDAQFLIFFFVQNRCFLIHVLRHTTFNSVSKTETQYEAGSLVKQQVKDAVLWNVKKKLIQ